jgi:ubiquinone/menaquinone biosynthesis C-methylase UbiE
MARGDRDRMGDFSFRMMAATFAVMDLLFPSLDKRIQQFGLKEGMTVVDYGCGPGRYSVRFAKIVGERGKVYAVDIHELALEYVARRAEKMQLSNVIPVLASDYKSPVPGGAADMAFALDMFFGVKDPAALLAELHRIIKPQGVLILDDGHQPRSETLRKIGLSDRWRIREQNSDYLVCTPV